MGSVVRVSVIGHLLAMLDHKFGNFMVKGVNICLDMDYCKKSLRIKLLIRRKGGQTCTLGIPNYMLHIRGEYLDLLVKP